MREIEQLSNTHRQTVFERINSRHSEISTVNEAHLGRLEDLEMNHMAEKVALRHVVNALRDTHAKDWKTFNTYKSCKLLDLEATAADNENDFVESTVIWLCHLAAKVIFSNLDYKNIMSS
jgi:hypothetical protein